MTMWYRQYHRTWLWFCHSRIVVSPSGGLGGSTTGETTSPFTNQRRNGRAFSSLTARGGGLPIGVKSGLGRYKTSYGRAKRPVAVESLPQVRKADGGYHKRLRQMAAAFGGETR